VSENDEARFRRALEVFSEVDCQGAPEDIGIWCVGCIATNVLNGKQIEGEIGEPVHMANEKHLVAIERAARALVTSWDAHVFDSDWPELAALRSALDAR
jgi:hypothetical protein